jgi:nitroimidazol reductase NimA-like FMN-containing flavoprotein (pyridoxamine 5'-phosphate oxidase superfamily)
MVLFLTIVKLPKMDKREIEEVLQDQMLCRIAFKGNKYPYIAPFQYVFVDGSLYFHFTDYGRKMKLLEKDKRVCVEIEQYTSNLSEYKFIVIRGSLKLVRDPSTRSKVIERMAEEGKQRLSHNFLAAHGFKKEDEWSSLSPDKPIVVVELYDVIETLGLKSPT